MPARCCLSSTFFVLFHLTHSVFSTCLWLTSTLLAKTHRCVPRTPSVCLLASFSMLPRLFLLSLLYLKCKFNRALDRGLSWALPATRLDALRPPLCDTCAYMNPEKGIRVHVAMLHQRPALRFVPHRFQLKYLGRLLYITPTHPWRELDFNGGKIWYV